MSNYGIILILASLAFNIARKKSQCKLAVIGGIHPSKIIFITFFQM